MLIHPHLQSVLAVSPATQFSDSEQARRPAELSFLLTARSTRHPERRERERKNKSKIASKNLKSASHLLLTDLSLWPIAVSIRLPRGRCRLWRLFFCLLGSRGRCGRGSCYVPCRRWDGSGPRVLRDELGLASESVSVFGWRSCVATTQGDQQRWRVLPRDPLVSQEGWLQAGCVWVKVSLEQI